MAKKNPLIRPKPKTFYAKPSLKSKGILDDYAVRKTVNSKEGYFTTLKIEGVMINIYDDPALGDCLNVHHKNWFRIEGFVTRGETNAIGRGHLVLQNGAGDYDDDRRWQIGLIGLETGANVGSDLYWTSFDDSGTYNGVALKIERDTNYTLINPTLSSDLPYFDLDVNGDIRIRENNKLYFGGTGAGDNDVNLYRDSANVLKTDDKFESSSAEIGDGTNYTEIKTDGEINLHGTARVEKCHWICANGIKAPGSKPADFVEDGLTGCWEFGDEIEANQESVSGTVKTPCDMDRTIAPKFGIGWHANGVSPGDCKWQLEYLWVSPNEDVTAVAQETLTVVSTASATSDGLIVAEFTGIDLPSGTDVAMFWKITRLSADASDTIAAVTHMRGNYFKYTSNKLGVAT